MYTIHERVGASRTDRNGVMKLVSALDMIQDCSMHWMESEPAFRDYLKDRRLIMVLVSRQADILRLPLYGENVSVQTSIFERGSFTGYRNTVLYGEDGAPCVVTWSIGAFIEQGTGKLARLPPEIVSTISLDVKVDMTYTDKKITLPEGRLQGLDALPVRRGDIDLNGHMNNARYVEAALELLPPGFVVRRLRLEYKAAAKAGDLLYPLRCETGGAYLIVLADGSGRPYTVMEFS
jgi:acyl-ACP thioesterase